MRGFLSILIGFLAASEIAFSWGEDGHHMIGKVAARIVRFHPLLRTIDGDKLVELLEDRAIHEGHVSNIPDIAWKNLGGDNEDPANKLGRPTHYLDLDLLPRSTGAFPFQIRLDYEAAKTQLKRPDLFQKIGTLPWRAQQLWNLMKNSLSRYPASCKALARTDNHPTTEVLTYAGLLSHYIGDASQPYHATSDYDGKQSGHGGIHSYFEDGLVKALFPTLEPEVYRRAKRSLESSSFLTEWQKRAQALPDYTPARHVTALSFALLYDSFQQIEKVNQLDTRYALAKKDEECHGREECRRRPQSDVPRRGSGKPKTVASHFASILSERLALAAALLADLWVRAWQEGNRPTLCWTWNYALSPRFVSPTDPRQEGYALKEDREQFKLWNGKNALDWIP